MCTQRDFFETAMLKMLYIMFYYMVQSMTFER